MPGNCAYARRCGGLGAKKYIEYMGGEDAVLQKAKDDFDNGNYRCWAAMVLKHVVFANPDSRDGKNLLADSYEQLGYQAESGPWRSEYLQGAYELRNGVPNIATTDAASPDTIQAMPPEKSFDYLAVRLNGPKAAGKNITLNIDFTELNREYGLTVKNAVLNYAPVRVPDANANLTLTKATFDDIQLKNITLDQAISSNQVTIDGEPGCLQRVHRVARHLPVLVQTSLRRSRFQRLSIVLSRG